MLLQRAGTGTIPPSGFIPPPWEVLAESWEKQPLPATETVTLGPAEVTLGHDDDESQDDSTEGVLEHAFGWDNENPKRTVKVEKFRIEWRPVTNGQFYEFYTSPGKDKVQFPKSWIELNGEVFVSRSSIPLMSCVYSMIHGESGSYTLRPCPDQDCLALAG